MAGFALWMLTRRWRRPAAGAATGLLDFSQSTASALVALLSEDF